MGNDASKTGSFGFSSTAEDVTKGVNLSGKTILITGANTGIGKESSRVLSKRGANVYMLCRNKTKGEQAIKDIINELNNDNEYKTFCENENISDIKSRLNLVICDLGSLKSIFDFCKNFTELNVKLNSIILNAGIFCPGNFELTTDNFELQFGVNHLGHYYLMRLLLPILLNNEFTRIVCVSSNAHKWAPDTLNKLIHYWYKNNESPNKQNYDPKGYYGISKCCNILFSRGLHYKYYKSGIESVSLHPGLIRSDLFRNQKITNYLLNTKLGKAYSKSVEQGASTQIRCVILGRDDIECGGYYNNCNIDEGSLVTQMKPTKIKTDEQFTKSMEGKLWELSENLIKSKGFPIDINGEITIISNIKNDDIKEANTNNDDSKTNDNNNVSNDDTTNANDTTPETQTTTDDTNDASNDNNKTETNITDDAKASNADPESNIDKQANP